ncbi:16S rRNA (cytidine(1402)-2'-O)-methyltransferase [candidate division WWE3 bacterium]|uniref:Ribosomal RNA small subunit methyltransferase I n=1 Tax=candidate division WWE3 bacterium TaxID=2053526 RepID=A0A7X9DL42_UNCKA|nr:16S rRNA (cytidine(1402)-2'-O)-methyltransferase [candidate division WWE3 bacterium]
MDEQRTATKLKIVSTPIGNMADITLRAIEELRDADVILSEDTRETDKLLKHFNIAGKENISYRDQNHDRIYPKIVSYLNDNKKVVLVSNSGTPLISDPGFKLGRDLIKDGYDIETIPGPSAVIAALTVSGLPTDKFTFLGFLPRTKGDRRKILKNFGDTEATLVIYESPFRILTLLEDIVSSLGNRQICMINDITKVYEKKWYGNVISLQNQLKNYKLKGEFVLVIAKDQFK